MPHPAEGELGNNKALAVCARAGAGFIEQDHGSFLEQAGANPAEYIVRRLPLQDDVVDTGLAWSSCPSSNPAGPAPMMTTWSAKPCSHALMKYDMPTAAAGLP